MYDTSFYFRAELINRRIAAVEINLRRWPLKMLPVFFGTPHDNNLVALKESRFMPDALTCVCFFCDCYLDPARRIYTVSLLL